MFFNIFFSIVVFKENMWLPNLILHLCKMPLESSSVDCVTSLPQQSPKGLDLVGNTLCILPICYSFDC